ncbi:M24 family metallopeptidase [Paenibacillus gansuensis]|uniref:M24 family metallopeptidase n=1 Tax=Paenibacillus gansuensis TaxID=306542 RepID=A0ABW5PAS6_9BACL
MPTADRKTTLIQYMSEHSIDLAVITSPTNVYYFTGFYCNPHERFFAYVVDGRTGEETLFVPLLDRAAAQEEGSVSRVVGISDTEDGYEVLKREKGSGVHRIGLEKNMVSLLQGERFAGLWPGCGFDNIEEFILSLRMKKSEQEIGKVVHAVKLVEQVLDHAVKLAVPGMTELELTAELEFQMKRLGAERPSFDSIVLTGARSALPHGVPGHTPIENNAFLLIDIGVKADGYCSDITRTFLMGEGTKEQESIYDAVLNANLLGIAAVQAGRPVSVLDDAARNEISRLGYGEYFTHRVGHGFGMDIHEAPSISGNNGLIMEPGLLFTIEPGIYVPSVGGVRIEDDVYIGEDGQARVLTSYPKELTRLG